MEAVSALARLRSMTASSTDPVLTEEELDLLLEGCRLEDSEGVAPGGTDWIGTYDLSRAAAEGWRWKAGKAASRYQFASEGVGSFNRNQVVEACERMAKMYAGKVISSVSVVSPLSLQEDEEEDTEA